MAKNVVRLASRLVKAMDKLDAGKGGKNAPKLAKQLVKAMNKIDRT